MTRFVSSAASLIAMVLSGCVSFPPAPERLLEARIDGGRLYTIDGAVLGLEVWRAVDPTAVIVAVHGMNDYAGHFAEAASWLSTERRISVYAYDQRGFGRSPGLGLWPGEGALKSDLNAAIFAVRLENPVAPVYVLGHSMGAAVIMAAASDAPLNVDGAILAAPGVWGGGQMPVVYRLTANIAASVAPGKTLTGERAGRQASDNIAALQEMYADPLVIKPTRLDAVLGVARLMGRAYDVSDEIGGRVLFLTGARDEIIPLKSQQRAAKRLCGGVAQRLYADGWHLLLRDLQRETVWRDIAAWIAANHGDENAAGRQFGPAAFACAPAGRQ